MMPRGFLLVSVPTMKSSSSPILSIRIVRIYCVSGTSLGRATVSLCCETRLEPGQAPRKWLFK